jgi:hypothetical protein
MKDNDGFDNSFYYSAHRKSNKLRHDRTPSFRRFGPSHLIALAALNR